MKYLLLSMALLAGCHDLENVNPGECTCDDDYMLTGIPEAKNSIVAELDECNGDVELAYSDVDEMQARIDELEEREEYLLGRIAFKNYLIGQASIDICETWLNDVTEQCDTEILHSNKEVSQ